MPPRTQTDSKTFGSLNPKWPGIASYRKGPTHMIQDFRFAFRQLVKTPGFTVVAVITLALAIGVISAIFALINGVVLRPMVPVKSEEVVIVFIALHTATHDYRQFSYNDCQELGEYGKET